MLKLTKKDLENFGAKVFYVAHGELQRTLLRDFELGTNYGKYGWNWDAYLFNDIEGTRIIINTGERNLCGVRIPNEFCKAADDFAYKIIHKLNDYVEVKYRLYQNLQRLIIATEDWYNKGNTKEALADWLRSFPAD